MAIEINALDNQANYHAGQAVVYAAKCGEKLAIAKQSENLKTKESFVEWLGNNSPNIKVSNAYSYISLPKKMPQLLDSSVQMSGLNLPSVSQAIELLSASEKVRTEITERIESGKNVTVREIQELKRKAKEAEEKLKEKEQELLEVELSKE